MCFYFGRELSFIIDNSLSYRYRYYRGAAINKAIYRIIVRALVTYRYADCTDLQLGKITLVLFMNCMVKTCKIHIDQNAMKQTFKIIRKKFWHIFINFCLKNYLRELIKINSKLNDIP